MHRFTRALLFTAVIGIVSTGTLSAQRGGAVGARAPLPSSTAIGAGALSRGPSATSRSSGPSFAYGYGYGPARSGYGGSYARGNNYRTLPRGYVVAPFYYPLFDWSGGTDSSSAAPYEDPGYSGGYGPDPATDAMLRNQAALGQQVQRLTDQMNGMVYGQGYQQLPAQAQQGPPAIPLTLVLTTGEKLQVQNYAVTNNMFWDFTQRGTRKIPLSNIDLAASAKATQANGGDFPQLDGTQ